MNFSRTNLSGVQQSRRLMGLVGAAIVGAAAVGSLPAADAALCPCDVVDGPFKTWVMLADNTLSLVNCVTGMEVGRVQLGGACTSITSKPDCSTIFVGTRGGQNPDGTMKPPGFCDIDCETLDVIERPLPAAPIPDGMICLDNKIILALENGTVAFFNCDTEEIRFVDVAGGCVDIIAKCGGNTIFVATRGGVDPTGNPKPPGFCDIDCETLEVIERPLPVPPLPNGFWLSPDNRKLFILLEDGSVFVFDCETQQPAAVIPLAGSCNSIVGKCDGSTVWVGNVGGAVPQTWFPPVPQNRMDPSLPPFVVDDFAKVQLGIELDFDGNGQFQPVQALGDLSVARGMPERQPGTPSVLPIEIVSMNLRGHTPLGEVRFGVSDIRVGQGQLVGSPQSGTDFPAQPVDSFFDITLRLEIEGPDGTATPFESFQPTRFVLDPQGPPVVQVPFGCDKWLVPEGAPPTFFKQVGPGNPDLPPVIVGRCDVICFPPPPPPKGPNVCDIDCATLTVLNDFPLPAPPIPCGVTIKPGDDPQIWVALADGTVGGWDCDWNPLFMPIQLAGPTTSARWKPDGSALILGTAGDPAAGKEPGICDIPCDTLVVNEIPLGSVPLPKGIWICPQPMQTNDCQFDFDGNGQVDGADFGAFGAAFGSMLGDPNYSPQADSNGDGVVDGADFGDFGAEFGRADCLQ